MVVWGGFAGSGDVCCEYPTTGGRYALGQAIDNDGDGLSECDGDCNDGQPAIFPGASETCDLLDNDCNGIADDADADRDGYFACGADCDDHDAGVFAIPAEVTGLRFAADGSSLDWDSALPGSGSATVHDVLSGVVAELPVGSGAAETCVETTAASSIVVSDVPLPGDVTWYLVRGRNPCGDGTYGNASDGTLRESPACP
jgi:hypothetical protein